MSFISLPTSKPLFDFTQISIFSLFLDF